MTTVYRVSAVWNGFQGAPGYSKFSFQDLTTDTARNAAGAAIRAFFNALSSYMQNTWTVAVQGEVQEFDMATGAMTGANMMTTIPAAVAGASAVAQYAGGSGMCITWRTGVIFNGRRVQGRTFLVPAVLCYDTDGTLGPSAITALTAAGNTLIGAAGAELAVWGRQYTSTTPPVQVGGALPPVTSCVVKDATSQLRTRRT